jgi:hypothetical protein
MNELLAALPAIAYGVLAGAALLAILIALAVISEILGARDRAAPLDRKD